MKKWISVYIATLAMLVVMTGCSAEDKSEEKDCCSGITRESLGAERATFYTGAEVTELKENVPDGMVVVPGGMAIIGSNAGLPEEQPEFTTEVSSFYMDKNLVTVADFREFVEDTGYQTYSDIIGDGIVFDFDAARWVIKEGVNWEFPLGQSHPKASDNHPVTLLTRADAEAYLEWSGKRLPTEIEWEHAARGITNRDDPYAWGRELMQNGKFMANTWVGEFPVRNVADDGFIMTSPVGEFGETELGLTDMGGNVWEWTASWFRPYADRDRPYTPGEASEAVIRGGSFMCHESYCHGYRVSARSNTPPDNNMFHIGFRGVQDIAGKVED